MRESPAQCGRVGNSDLAVRIPGTCVYKCRYDCKSVAGLEAFECNFASLEEEAQSREGGMYFVIYTDHEL